MFKIKEILKRKNIWFLETKIKVKIENQKIQILKNKNQEDILTMIWTKI